MERQLVERTLVETSKYGTWWKEVIGGKTLFSWKEKELDLGFSGTKVRYFSSSVTAVVQENSVSMCQ